MLLLTMLVLLACGDKDGDTAATGDGGTADAGSGDAGTTDGGTADGGSTDGGSTDGGSGDGGTEDGGAGDGGSGDGGTTVEGSFEASGLYDGVSFHVRCDGSTISGGSTGDEVPWVNLACFDASNQMAVAVAVTGPEVGKSTACTVDNWVQVTDGSTGGNYNCYVGGVTGFALEITSVEVHEDGSVSWAGSFVLSGEGNGHSASVSGTFSGTSPRT